MEEERKFRGYVITDEEKEQLDNVLLKIREEKEHKILTQKAKMAISFEISDAISRIGLEETKRIVRELARELRNLD